MRNAELRNALLKGCFSQKFPASPSSSQLLPDCRPTLLVKNFSRKERKGRKEMKGGNEESEANEVTLCLKGEIPYCEVENVPWM